MKDINSEISNYETKIDELNNQLLLIYNNSRGSKTSVMPTEYYKLLKERQSLEAKLRPILNERSRIKREKMISEHNEKTFVNSFGEATKREITCDTYKRSLRKTESAVLRNMGM